MSWVYRATGDAARVMAQFAAMERKAAWLEQQRDAALRSRDRWVRLAHYYAGAALIGPPVAVLLYVGLKWVTPW